MLEGGVVGLYLHLNVLEDCRVRYDDKSALGVGPASSMPEDQVRPMSVMLRRLVAVLSEYYRSYGAPLELMPKLSCATPITELIRIRPPTSEAR